MPNPPNILFLFSDQHSARALGCYGNPEVRTPHLDALAESGIRMDNAYAQSPICTPSRMCFHSGQYCQNHGYYGLMGPPPPNLPSLFTLTREAGYLNGMVGKIHTPVDWLGRDCHWVEGINTAETTRPLPGDFVVADSELSPYDQYLQAKGIAHLRDDQSVPLPDGRRLRQAVDARPSELDPEDTLEGWAAQRSIRFMEHAFEQEQPFCLWMTVSRPHQTYLPARKFWDLYDPARLSLPPNADNPLQNRSDAARETAAQFRDSTEWRVFGPEDDWETSRRRVLQGYYGCVSQVDDAVGQVLQALERLGMRENTIIVYSTDHGEFAGEHGLIEKAPGIGFRCVTRIPMIWSFGNTIPSGVFRSNLVESVDTLPTLAALAGLPTPDWTDGLDICSLLHNDAPVRDYAVTEHPLSKTIHSLDYKLTLFLPEMHEGRPHGELFHTGDDPYEMENLFNRPEYAEVQQQLTYALYCWVIRNRRHKTVNPQAPDPDHPGGMISWNDAAIHYGRDGKVKPDVYGEIIRRGKRNYL